MTDESDFLQASTYILETADRDRPADSDLHCLDHVISQLYAGDNVPPLRTGLTAIDRLVQGFKPGDLVVVASRPSMGKSALVGQWLEVWSRQGIACAFFSLEMPRRQVLFRMLAGEANVPLSDLLHARSPHLTVALERMRRWPLLIDDRGGLNVLQVARKARQAKVRYGLRAVVVDNLQLMESAAEDAPDRNSVIEATTRALKVLAKELQVPVILLSQLNRALESRPNKRPVLSDLPHDGMVDQHADLVIALHREEVYRFAAEEWAGLAEAIVLKNRQGATGTARLRWHGSRVHFAEFAGQWPGDRTATILPFRRGCEG